MEGPVCLVDNPSGTQMRVTAEARALLDRLDQPLVVVTVAGLYRTGKSYLLNRLAGEPNGFSLGSTVQSHTKGIWMWPRPHPCRPGHTLLLLDTEGLGDVEKGDSENDHWLFSLAVLLSSTLVYNSMKTIDQNALEKLHFVTELSEHIQMKAGEEDDTQFYRFFPHFVWTVRDFTLQLSIDGKEVTEDEYLENALKLKSGHSKKIHQYNLPRQCLRDYFPTRKCFAFPQPVAASEMGQLEHLDDGKLDPLFLQKSRFFCDYVLAVSPVKTLGDGNNHTIITGKKFGGLVQSYVEMIRSGTLPCLENAVISLAKIENGEAVRGALAIYDHELQGVSLPIERDLLSEQHRKAEKEALAYFMKKSFKDQGGKCQAELMAGIGQRYYSLLDKNEAASIQVCQDLLAHLVQTLERELSQGGYTRPGGYELYKAERDRVVERFRKSPNKGVKAEEVLQEFLAKREAEGRAVLQADQNLTQAQKQVAEESARAEQVEQQWLMEEEKRRQAEQLLKDQEQSHQENLQQLQSKMEEEARRIREEASHALESRLQEQEKLLRMGFEEKSQSMKEELEKLQREAADKGNWIGTFRELAKELVQQIPNVLMYRAAFKNSAKR
ncbi:guanylate-binding protein 1-like [Ornithorhynchus anatinus]|uniref:GB1/RHD3-type G domain-containing protein n=1 Tax=Ornithorhynchus anatinus TaxID=9258 RepID=F7DK61_ORNAN|nr:guanylate-binding protein 1-like [Ornithorhynchus anatinus]